MGTPQSYLSRMGKDAKVFIPKLMLDLLKRDKPNLEATLLQVALDPGDFDFFYLFEMRII